MSGARLDRSRPPTPGELRPFRFPPFIRRRLQNGIDVLAAHWSQMPVTSLELVAPAGGEHSARPGLASLHGELLDEGTQRRTVLEVAASVERLGAYLATGADWQVGYVGASCLSWQLDAVLELVAEVVREPSFPVEEVERLRRQRLAEILHKKDQPRAIADLHLMRAIYGGTVYADPLIGTEESVAGLGHDELLRFYEGHFGPRDAALVVVGDGEPDELVGHLEAAFGDWQSEAAPPPPSFEPTPLSTTEVHVVDRPGASQTQLQMGHLGIARNHPDHPLALLMNSILGGKFTSRINLSLRERHGLTYGAFSQFVYRRLGGHFQMRAAVATDRTAVAVSETLAEMRRMQDEPVSPEDVRESQDFLVGLFPSTLQTAGDIVKRLETLSTFELPDDYYEGYPGVIRELGREDVARAARLYLHPERLAIVAVGPAEELVPQLERFGRLTVWPLDDA